MFFHWKSYGVDAISLGLGDSKYVNLSFFNHTRICIHDTPRYANNQFGVHLAKSTTGLYLILQYNVTNTQVNACEK